ncbi:MAG: class I SAM-dependent methyltransferase [Solirubrobacteraceae bacterium]
MGVRAHWEKRYTGRESSELSWYEASPQTSMAMIEVLGLGFEAAIIDVGGGTSALAGELVDAGYRDVSVVDISSAALARARAQGGESAERIRWIQADVRVDGLGRTYDLWHDRAVFHFMVEATDRARYLQTLKRSLRPGGHLIIATFGPDGPAQCSDLPVSRYGPDELASVLGADFRPVSSMLREHRTPSGRSQQFLHAHLRHRAPTTPGRDRGPATAR